MYQHKKRGQRSLAAPVHVRIVRYTSDYRILLPRSHPTRPVPRLTRSRAPGAGTTVGTSAETSRLMESFPHQLDTWTPEISAGKALLGTATSTMVVFSSLP